MAFLGRASFGSWYHVTNVLSHSKILQPASPHVFDLWPLIFSATKNCTMRPKSLWHWNTRNHNRAHTHILTKCPWSYHLLNSASSLPKWSWVSSISWDYADWFSWIYICMPAWIFFVKCKCKAKSQVLLKSAKAFLLNPSCIFKSASPNTYFLTEPFNSLL